MTETSGREKVLEEALRRVQDAGDLCHVYDIARAALASSSTQEPALRGGKVEEIADRARKITSLIFFGDEDWATHRGSDFEPTDSFMQTFEATEEYIAAALRTHAGESAAQSERAGLERAARLADEWNWRHRSVTNQPCPDDFHSSLGDAIRSLSAARKAGGE